MPFSVNNSVLIFPLVFAVFFAISRYSPSLPVEFNTTFVSMVVLLFSTLSGFFIARQSARYVQITHSMSNFDGNVSFLYRSSSIFGTKFQKKVADVVERHYQNFVKGGGWEGYTKEERNTIRDLDQLFGEVSHKTDLSNAQQMFMNRVYHSLCEMQKLRKNMVIRFQEKIPSFQWILMDILAILLVLTIYGAPTGGKLFSDIITSLSATVVIAILVLLRKLNNLTLFESRAGQSSVQDVLDIIQSDR